MLELLLLVPLGVAVGAFGTLVGAGNGIDTPFFMTVASTPEPGTWMLMAGGAALIALRRKIV